MSNVIEMPARVEVSDFAKALLQIETESQLLDEQSRRLAQDAQEVMARANETLLTLSNQQTEILQKRMALDEVKMKMLLGKAGL